MKTKINNIVELKAEVARLTLLKKQQEAYLADQYDLLKHKVQAPARFVGLVTSSIPGVDMLKGLVSSFSSKGGSTGAVNQPDWLGRAMKLGLPLLLNRTFLRRSGWLKNILVLLLSEKAVGSISQDKVSHVLSKITDFVRPKKKGKKKHKDIEPLIDDYEGEAFNYGVPPNSETD